MNPASKLGAFGLALAAILGLGALAGNVVGPIDTSTVHADDEEHAAADGDGAGAGGHEAATAGSGADLPAGVLIAQDGYTLVPETTTFEADPRHEHGPELRFRILGPDGEPVRDFVERHERDLHLIVVGSDLATYDHLHPTRSDGGTWSVALPRLAPGTYRAFADFAVAGGPELTLGVDLAVAGDTAVAPLPSPAETATVDGYDVALSGTPSAGEASGLTLTVRRDGRPVTDLEPYLGAFGHLVAIRGGDLAYLHVHPLAGDRGGPEVAFAVEVPSPGDYRLFFDFSHGGTVRTAAFTVHVPAGEHDAGDQTATTTATGAEEEHG